MAMLNNQMVYIYSAFIIFYNHCSWPEFLFVVKMEYG